MKLISMQYLNKITNDDKMDQQKSNTKYVIRVLTSKLSSPPKIMHWS